VLIEANSFVCFVLLYHEKQHSFCTLPYRPIQTRNSHTFNLTRTSADRRERRVLSDTRQQSSREAPARTATGEPDMPL